MKPATKVLCGRGGQGEGEAQDADFGRDMEFSRHLGGRSEEKIALPKEAANVMNDIITDKYIL